MAQYLENDTMTIKTGDIITAQQLISIIAAHGGGHASVNGEMPWPYTTAAELDLDGSERFEAVINYGHEVQFHLVSDSMRAHITTGLRGRVERMEWVAA